MANTNKLHRRVSGDPRMLDRLTGNHIKSKISKEGSNFNTPNNHSDRKRRSTQDRIAGSGNDSDNDGGNEASAGGEGEEDATSNTSDAESDFTAPSGQDIMSRSGIVSTDARVGTTESKIDQAGLALDALEGNKMNQTKKRRLSSTVKETIGGRGVEEISRSPAKKLKRQASNNTQQKWKYENIEVAALRALAAEAKQIEEALASDDDDEVYKQLDDPGNDSDGDSLMELPEDALLAASDGEDETATPGQTLEGSASDQEYNDPSNELRLSAKIDNFFGTGGFLGDVDAFDADDYIPSFLAEPTNPRRKSESSERRVRFQDEVVHMASSTSSSSSSEFDVDTFPDLLDALDRETIVSRETLDQMLLHQLDGDDEFDSFGAWEGSDDAGSEYDFGENEAAMHVFKRVSKVDSGSEDSSDSDSGSLSGYDSDGDTTDDDLPTLQTISRPKTVLHSPTRTPQAKAAPLPFPRNRRVIKRGPVMGTFQAVEGKPFAYYDANTKRLRIVSTPRRAHRLLHSAGSSASNSPHVPYNGLEYESDTTVTQLPSSLFPGNLDVMMSGVFGGPPGQRFQNGRFVSNHSDLYGGSFGAPEAFFPQKLDSLSEEGSDYSTETNSSAAEIDVLSDFVHLEQLDPAHTTDEDETIEHASEPVSTFVSDDSVDVDGSDNDDDDDGGHLSNPSTPKARATGGRFIKSTPFPRKHSRNLSSSMLAHFDRGVVSSFRNNQDRYRLLSQLPNGINEAKPLKAGKSAMDVITPPRRRRGKKTAAK